MAPEQLIQPPPHFWGLVLHQEHNTTQCWLHFLYEDWEPQSARPCCCDELIVVNKAVDELGTSSRTHAGNSKLLRRSSHQSTDLPLEPTDGRHPPTHCSSIPVQCSLPQPKAVAFGIKLESCSTGFAPICTAFMFAKMKLKNGITWSCTFSHPNTTVGAIHQ